MRRSGFTLVEAVVSTAIVTFAGSALLLGIASAIDSTDMVLEQMLAEGMAQQLMDEIAGRRYAEAGLGGHQTTLGPETGESSGFSRQGFDDLDDYHQLSTSPPCDAWGIRVGEDDSRGSRRVSSLRRSNRFDTWRQFVEVHYADPSDLTRVLAPGQTSNYRLVIVTIDVRENQTTRRPLAQLTRVFSYVPHN